ncbi:hypothetical protein [Actinoplanes sp. M2I2]|uniref:hypothetical protein n=1 Tax=Actinoplanes sp. M2I2 TaxID=1734444 RepID=UPI0020223185|nr:hypothetical protein [Actinoplanes sp. M2I2]
MAEVGYGGATRVGWMGVTETDKNAELSALRRTAQQRTKRRLVLATAVVVGSAALGASGFAWGKASDAPVTSRLLVAAGVAIVMAGILWIIWAVQKRVRNAPLMMGADKATQRAVRAALRRGHTADPNVDALTRDLIERSHTPRWTPYLYPLLAAFFVALLFMGDRDAEDVIRTAVAVVSSLMVGGAFWLHLRRLHNYRGLAPTTPQAD